MRVKGQYTLQQLRDLVADGQDPDGVSGQQLLLLIADVTWCHSIARKRYSEDSPQGRDPACKNSQEYLDRLQKGERIFVMDGVIEHNPDGTPTGEVYGPDISDAGILEGSRLHSNIDCARRFWGNTNASHYRGPGQWCDDGENASGGCR